MYLASRSEAWVTTVEIAEVLRIPRNHLLKVVNRMIEMGWIEGKRGRSGGVRFIATTSDVSVAEVIHGLEQSLALVECFQPGKSECPLDSTCRLASALYHARKAFLNELSQVTIGQLLPPAGDSGHLTLLATG